MTTDAPSAEEPEDRAASESDLKSADAAEAPNIAEALADQLEAELDDVADTAGGGG